MSVTGPVRSGSNPRSGVSTPRMSVTGAAAVTTSVIGETTAFPSHTVRIDIESLPTGIAMPSAGASSAPAARTASYARGS